MRISLLESREEFYSILIETLEKSDLLKRTKSAQPKTYLVNRYLNFVTPRNLQSKAFENIKNEYSNSHFWSRRLIQKIYVSLAISRFFRGFFAHKCIIMPDYGPYLILGGNHRLRLFTKDLNGTWSILKNGERSSYIENDVQLRKCCNLSYAPRLLGSGRDWIMEEFFEGIPINRLADSDEILRLELQVTERHRKELLFATKEMTSCRDYFSMVINEVDLILDNVHNNTDHRIIENIRSTFSILFHDISEIMVPISWSHGDFQEANILTRNNDFMVIDWEASAKRFIWYDFFVLFGGIRKSKELESSINLFLQGMDMLKIEVKRQEILFCIIEELRYCVNEEFSENYFFCGKSVLSLCENILNWIHE